jgi:hypothetical protein
MAAELFLYVVEYFQTKRIKGIPASEVIQEAIYAANTEAAVMMMNEMYANNNKGHMHKSLALNTHGITINGVYYPPTMKWKGTETPPLRREPH